MKTEIEVNEPWKLSITREETDSIKFTVEMIIPVSVFKQCLCLIENNDREEPPLTSEVVSDALSLADWNIPGEVIEQWSKEEKQQAFDVAAAIHLAASDNDGIRFPPMPECLAANISKDQIEWYNKLPQEAHNGEQ